MADSIQLKSVMVRLPGVRTVASCHCSYPRLISFAPLEQILGAFPSWERSSYWPCLSFRVKIPLIKFSFIMAESPEMPWNAWRETRAFQQVCGFFALPHYPGHHEREPKASEWPEATLRCLLLNLFDCLFPTICCLLPTVYSPSSSWAAAHGFNCRRAFSSTNIRSTWSDFSKAFNLSSTLSMTISAFA